MVELIIYVTFMGGIVGEIQHPFEFSDREACMEIGSQFNVKVAQPLDIIYDCPEIEVDMKDTAL